MFVLRHIRKKRKLMINRLTGGSWPPAEGRQINGVLWPPPHLHEIFREPAGHGDFRHLVDREGWAGLAVPVQARFNTMIKRNAPTHYTGDMRVERNWLGWAFAQACRLIGTPLTPFAGENVPVAVNVFEGRGGTVWERVYFHQGRAPLTVSSVKVVDPKRGLLECVLGGLGMALRVYAEGGALHFRAKHYFLKIGPWHLRIPLVFTPGVAHVTHRDKGNGAFRFTLTFTHPAFGRTIHQEGIFTETGETL